MCDRERRESKDGVREVQVRNNVTQKCADTTKYDLEKKLVKVRLLVIGRDSVQIRPENDSKARPT